MCKCVCVCPRRAQGRGAGGLPAPLMQCAMHPLSEQVFPLLARAAWRPSMAVCFVAEYQAQGYCVRELQVWRPDRVSLEGDGTYRARVRAPRGSPGLGLRRARSGRTPYLASMALDPVGQCPPVGHILRPGSQLQNSGWPRTPLGLSLHSLFLASLGSFSVPHVSLVAVSVPGTGPSPPVLYV